jgi:1-deoxy-D-xylulose-5-phosphate reductoisomerase
VTARRVTPMAHNDPVSAPRRVILLGSTGSIGTQAIDVALHAPDRFAITAIAAGGSDLPLLAKQAAQLRVETVGVGRADAADELRALLQDGWPADAPPPRVVADAGASVEMAAMDADVVLNAVAGAQGLRATLAALDAGTRIALANKESLVAGGPLVTDRAGPGQIAPVDSEHSAVAQCLRSGTADEVRKLVLTASGGPFRGRTREQMRDVTPREALAHPTWDMGQLITTNSATLVNKGLEVIEAHLLFGVSYDDIQVVVHPQSYIHSMVEFVDGSTVLQASPPDMRLTIALALGWPDRVDGSAAPVDWSTQHDWHFEPLDDTGFPAVELARTAGRAGGSAPAVYNAANEELVGAFHDGAVGFLDIVDTVARVLDEWLSAQHDLPLQPGTVVDVERADAWARERACSVAARHH